MIIGDGGAALSDPGALRAVFGAAVYMTGGAVIGLALGALLRSSPAAIATLFGIMFLLEGISMLLLPQAWQDEVIKFLPSAAGSAVGAVTPGAFNLAPGPALAVFAGYLVVFSLAAAWRLRRHDA
jgi:ABC-2 type transport system permease protein